MTIKDGFTPDGLQLITVHKSFVTPSVTLVSVDYSKTQTWWHGSDRVADEIVAISGAGSDELQLANFPIINTWGFTEGDASVPGHYDPADYSVVVKKNSAALVGLEHSYEVGGPASPGGDAYVVNYATGKVTFDASQAGHSFTVSYSKPNTGSFRLSPPAGFKYLVEHVELQFTVGHTWNSPMVFGAGWNNSATGNTDVVVKPYTYRRFSDILNKANLGTVVPPGGNLLQESYQIPFDYVSGYVVYPRGTDIPTSEQENAMNFLDLGLKYPNPITNCEVATASFYLIKKGV